MQDRFKFRVWKINEKRMVEGVTYLNPLILDEAIAPEEAKNNVLMQCTGLKDKNGKLIYEGDYLGGIWDGYIGYCHSCKSFALFIDDDCMACQGDVLWYELVEEDNKLEVIGNIWESPELVTW